jgi:hypothetical protein
LVATALFVAATAAAAEYFTIAATHYFPANPPKPDIIDAPVNVPAGSLAQVVSGITGNGGAILYYTKPGSSNYYLLKTGGCVVGPATISIDPGYSSVAGASGWATIKIEPQSFPPDKTMILGAGTNTAAITMECSTNLVHWTTCTNGFYGGSNSAMFFRINGVVITPP